VSSGVDLRGASSLLVRISSIALNVFSLDGGFDVFAGVLRKTDAATWCFDGEFVVECVVNEVI
jgi:hypothetical protein